MSHIGSPSRLIDHSVGQPPGQVSGIADEAQLAPPCRNWKRLTEVALSILLLTAAGLKADWLIRGPGPSRAEIFQDPIPVGVIVPLELLLGLWLLIGRFARARFWAAIVCFAIFAMVSGYEAWQAMPSCGCFGNVKVPPAATSAVDCAAAIALWITRSRQRGIGDRPPSRRRRVVGVVTAALLSAGFWTGFSQRRASVAAGPTPQDALSLVVLEPKTWLGKPFPLLDEIDGGAALRKGRWVVVLYHFDCDSCRAAIPRYSAWVESAERGVSQPRLAFIAMPPAAPPGTDPVAPSPEYERMTLRADKDWFATTLVAVAMEVGRVLAANDGEQAENPPVVARWKQ